MESTYGKMEESTMDSGLIMIWKALASTFGETAEGMKDSIIMTRKVDLGYISGLMAGGTKAGGLKENNMVQELTWILQREKLNMDSGKMEKD